MRLALPFSLPFPSPTSFLLGLTSFSSARLKLRAWKGGFPCQNANWAARTKERDIWRYRIICVEVDICRLLREFKFNFACQTLANPPPGSCYAMRKRKSRHRLHSKGDFLESEEGFFPSFEGDRERKE